MTDRIGVSSRYKDARQAARRIYERLFGFYRGEYGRSLRRATRGCRTLLDVGCGSLSPLRTVTPQMEKSVGVDVWAEAIEQSRTHGIHSEYVQADALEIEQHFAPASFDCVAATDLLEHLEKEQGFELLRQMESLARRKVVIFTPNGFVPQEEYGGNPFQAHRSGWSADEMRALGYRVYGIHGWKPLRGEQAAVTRRPMLLWEAISLLSQYVVHRRPHLAFHLLCVKTLAKPAASVSRERESV